MKLPYRLPVAPLIPWIKECIEKDSAEAFADRCGISPKRFTNILNGKDVLMSFDYMDKMLAREGSRTIIDFFPEYTDDEFLNMQQMRVEPAKAAKKCNIDGCDRPFHGKGLCDRHYRMSRRGTLVV
jgi:hypothetical protein